MEVSILDEKNVNVTNITIHESFHNLLLKNDIALLELSEDVDLNIYTPACLARTSDTNAFYGENATVYGWGTTSPGRVTSPKLMEVAVPVVTPDQCSGQATDGDRQICAGGEGNEDSCEVNIRQIWWKVEVSNETRPDALA